MPVQTLRLSYYPWITQNMAQDVLRGYIQGFAVELSKQLSTSGAPIDVMVQDPVAVPVQIQMIAEASTDISLMNPLGYAFARQRNAAVSAAAVALRMIDGKEGDVYFAQLYTNRITAIATGIDKDLADGDPAWGQIAKKLSGRKMGYGSRQSTSNFLMPAYLMWRQGIHPFTTFETARFVGGHDTVAQAVYNGSVDLGAGHDGVIVDLSNQYSFGDAMNRLVRIARVTIKSDPVVINIQDANLAQRVTAGLLAAGKTQGGKSALAGFWGGCTGLAGVKADAYDSLLDAAKALGLREQDVMG